MTQPCAPPGPPSTHNDPDQAQTLADVYRWREAVEVARTQAERSAATQSALVDAAIDLSTEHRWAATTSVSMGERVGARTVRASTITATGRPLFGGADAVRFEEVGA